MLTSLFIAFVLLILLGMTGLFAVSAFSALYLHSVAPEDPSTILQTGSRRMPEAKLPGLALLAALLIVFFLPNLTASLWGDVQELEGAHPMRLLWASSGLLAALVFLVGFNALAGGQKLLRWGGGKLSRPIFAFIVLCPMLAIAAALNNEILAVVYGGAEMPSELVTGLNQLEGGVFWLSAGLVVFAGPILEELLFRGAVFGAAGAEARRQGREAMLVAPLFSAAIFTLFHPPTVWLPLFLFGLALGCVRAQTGGVRDSIILHQLYNAVVFLMLFPRNESF